MSSDLPAGWALTRLGDQAEILPGFAFKSIEFTDEPDDIRLLRGDNVGHGRLRWTNARRWSHAKRAEFERYELRAGDVVLAMDRPWIEAGLKYALVRAEDLPCLLVQRVARLRAHGNLGQEYLRYVVGSPDFTRYVRAVQTGTAVPHISGAQISAFEFRLPLEAEQTRVAAVLGAIDDKIDSNERVGDLMSTAISTLVRHRVVDAEPNNSWTRGNLTSIARFVNGRAFTKHANGAGRPILRIKDLNGGVSDATPHSDIDAADDNVARHHDILFSWSGSLELYRWHGPESLINQHIFKVLPLEPYPAWFVVEWVRKHVPEFQRIAKDKATTMGHIKRENLTEAVVNIPPAALIEDLDAEVAALDVQAGALAAETRTLRAIRDGLLPKLISGEIRVSAADDHVPVMGVAASEALV